MRDRSAGDWTTDLEERHDLEAEVGQALACHPRLDVLAVTTQAFDRPDYRVITRSGVIADVELKAKWQHYRGWDHLRPDVAERDLFIIDELALRRLVVAGRLTQLLVFDAPSGRWLLFGVAELVLAPKARVSRRIERTAAARHKGKVLLDLRDAAASCPTLTDAVDTLAGHIGWVDRRWDDIAPWPTMAIDAAS